MSPIQTLPATGRTLMDQALVHAEVFVAFSPRSLATLAGANEDEAALLCANLARAGFIDTFTTSDGPMYCSTKRPPPPWSLKK